VVQDGEKGLSMDGLQHEDFQVGLDYFSATILAARMGIETVIDGFGNGLLSGARKFGRRDVDKTKKKKKNQKKTPKKKHKKKQKTKQKKKKSPPKTLLNFAIRQLQAGRQCLPMDANILLCHAKERVGGGPAA